MNGVSSEAWTVTDAAGRTVRPGDAVTSFRGEVRTFVRVERGPAANGASAKVVTVDSHGFRRGSYAEAFGLTVTGKAFGLPVTGRRVEAVAWAVLDAEDRVLAAHPERDDALVFMLGMGSATRVAPLVVDERPDRPAFTASAWALVGHWGPVQGTAVRVSFYDADVLREVHGGELLALRVADLDEVTA